MPRQHRHLLALLLLTGGCIDLSAIDIKIVRSGDTGLDTGDTGSDTGDTGEPDTEDSAETAETADTDTGEQIDTSWEPGPPLGTGVLLYEGDGALPVSSGPYGIDGVEALIDTYQLLGATVHERETLPDDLLPYRLMFWYMPGAAEAEDFLVPDSTTEALLAWFSSGGRLVIAGDVDGELDDYSLTRGNLSIDDVLERLRVNMRITAVVQHNLGCDSTTTHALMGEGATLEGYAGNDIQIEDPAQWLVCDGVAVQVMRCGEVVLSGDLNPFSDHPEEAPQLIENLYVVPGPDCG